MYIRQVPVVSVCLGCPSLMSKRCPGREVAHLSLFHHKLNVAVNPVTGAMKVIHTVALSIKHMQSTTASWRYGTLTVLVRCLPSPSWQPLPRWVPHGRAMYLLIISAFEAWIRGLNTESKRELMSSTVRVILPGREVSSGHSCITWAALAVSTWVKSGTTSNDTRTSLSLCFCVVRKWTKYCEFTWLSEQPTYDDSREAKNSGESVHK